MGKVSRDPVAGVAAAVRTYTALAIDLDPLHGAATARQLSRQAEYVSRLLESIEDQDPGQVRAAVAALRTLHDNTRNWCRNYRKGLVS